MTWSQACIRILNNSQATSCAATPSRLTIEDVEADPHGGVFSALGRILCYAGCAVGLAFLIALFAPGSGTAHADDALDAPAAVAEPDRTTAVEASAVGDSVEQAELWADPGAVSAAATRRASTDTTSSLSSLGPPPADYPADGLTRQAAGVHVQSGVASTPIGSFGGGGGGAPGAGPSIAQLAVLSAALLSVLWVSQRLLANELSWRSALIISGVERPG
jgi:hypothetical protein